MRKCSTCKMELEVAYFYSGEHRCKSCMNEKQRKYQKQNREKLREYNRRYYAEHRKECLAVKRKSDDKYRDELRARSKSWRGKNKEAYRESQRKTREKHRFSISIKQSLTQASKHGWVPCTATAEEIEAAFTGKCHICGVPESECNRRLSMDHDHETGAFRGWLCSECNHGIGMLRDSHEILQKAIEYLIAEPKRR